MQDQIITFVGGGNMGGALIGGLIGGGFPAANIRVADRDVQRLEQLATNFSVRTMTDNRQAVADADVVVLAVKPQVIGATAQDLADTLAPRRPLIMSIAAGVRCADLAKWLGSELPIVRIMPNTPALVGSGAAVLYATAAVSAEQRQCAESIMRTVGLALWVDDEDHLDAVTALSGSGPAYFFLVMEAMEQAAVKLGLSLQQARLLTLQTAFGAAKMALESDLDPTTLRTQVTSPGGTTECAIGILQDHDIAGTFAEALSAAKDRSTQLAKTFGDP